MYVILFWVSDICRSTIFVYRKLLTFDSCQQFEMQLIFRIKKSKKMPNQLDYIPSSGIGEIEYDLEEKGS